MGATLRITMLANCQARPVADFLGLMAPSVQLVGMLITHLAKLSDEELFDQWVTKSDFLFCQYVQDSFPVEFLRTSNLRARYGDKVVVWPNIFFRGQMPDLCYVTAPGSKRILGPLLEYHSRPIIDGWAAGRPVDAIVRDLCDPYADLGISTDIVKNSFAELRGRESYCDIVISDEIEESWQSRRLFFTFNHPSAYLLIRVGLRLLKHCACDHSIDLIPEHVGEPLSKIIPATWASISQTLQFKFPTVLSSRGSKFSNCSELKIINEVCFYAPQDLVEASYTVYDRQNFNILQCRIT